MLRLEQNQQFDAALLEELITRNRRLPDFKRVAGYLIWEKDFPRTASLKIKRTILAEDIGKTQRTVRPSSNCERNFLGGGQSRGRRRTLPQTGGSCAGAVARAAA